MSGLLCSTNKIPFSSLKGEENSIFIEKTTGVDIQCNQYVL